MKNSNAPIILGKITRSKHLPKMKIKLFLFLSIFSICNLFAQTDSEGCLDHPLITRYPGAVITYCDAKNFSEFAVATGPETGYQKIDSWVNVSGKQDRIYYSIKGDRIVTEIYQNYLSALKKGEFEILAGKLHAERNVSNDVGGNSWLSTFYKSNPYPANVGIKINQGSGSLGGTFYVAAKKGNLYVTVSGKRYSDNESVVLLDVLETSEMEDGLITINADYLTSKLMASGHVALQGILFDFNKATIKEDSRPLLAEIAKMMDQNPEFRLYVVGHTDMVGELRFNLELSVQRAAAVVNYLSETHKIALVRLSPQGVGPLTPVASNASEEGRSQNRRVELVLTNHQFFPR